MAQVAAGSGSVGVDGGASGLVVTLARTLGVPGIALFFAYQLFSGVGTALSSDLRDLRVAEVVKLDMQLDAQGKVEAFRAKLSVSFKFEGT